MISLYPIKDYLLEDVITLPDCDELGLVYHENGKYLTFIDDIKYFEQAVLNPCIKAILWDSRLNELNTKSDKTIIKTKNSRIAFFLLHNSMQKPIKKVDTYIDASASIDHSAHIAIHNVTIGRNVVVEPQVTIYEGTIIGENTIISSGARIGVEGLEAKKYADGKYLIVRHFGQVLIEDNVVIGPNTVVDRGLFLNQKTIIGSSTLIANLCHVAHAVKIGKRNFIAAGVKICGSTTIADDNWIGPGVIISNQLKIGSSTYITLGSSVFQNIADGWKVVGSKIFKERKLF